MAINDKALVAALDPLVAIGLLTRLPVSTNGDKAAARGAAAAWAWPVAGLLVGLLAALSAQITLGIGLPSALGSSIAAIALITTQIVITGGLHEDGLADSMDGLWGGWSKARRLEIMKDSRTGAYGVIALVLSLLMRWQVWTLLIASGQLWPAAVVIGVTSRVPMIGIMARLPTARDDGLSRQVGRPAARTFGLALAVAVALTLLVWPAALVTLVITISIITVLWAWIARAKIGGQTGDILGASQQLAEMVALLTLASLAL